MSLYNTCLQAAKYRLLLLFTVLFFVPVLSQAQNDRITLSRNRLSIGEAFYEIERQTPYRFGVNDTRFDTKKKVRLSSVHLSLRDALEQLLYNTGHTYLTHNNYILIISSQNMQKGEQLLAEYISADLRANPVDSLSVPLFEAQPIERQAADVSLKSSRVDLLSSNSPINYIPVDKYAYRKSHPPVIALKTNLLYGIGTLTPNLSAEIRLGQRSTLELTGSYNPWNLNGKEADNKKIVHWIAQAEYRYWLCENFNGHFFGIHPFYWQYNVGGYEIPLLFEKEYRSEGNAYGAGLSYGYHWMLSKKFGIEFNAGFGMAFMRYDKYGCDKCSIKTGEYKKTYFGPTKLAVSLVYILK